MQKPIRFAYILEKVPKMRILNQKNKTTELSNLPKTGSRLPASSLRITAILIRSFRR